MVVVRSEGSATGLPLLWRAMATRARGVHDVDHCGECESFANLSITWMMVDVFDAAVIAMVRMDSKSYQVHVSR